MNIALACVKPTVPFEPTDLEAIRTPFASHTLLAHTGNHLGNVDRGALAATLTHV